LGWKAAADVSVSVTVATAMRRSLRPDEKGQVTAQAGGRRATGGGREFCRRDGKGELNGKPYAAVASYATLTMPWKCPCSEDAEPAPEEKQESARGRADARCAIGAAVVAGAGVQFWRGGGRWLALCLQRPHGTEHDHSAANQSQHFRRVQLAGGKEWEELRCNGRCKGWRSWLTREACIASAA